MDIEAETLLVDRLGVGGVASSCNFGEGAFVGDDERVLYVNID